jgi:hypothetical protein
MAQNSSEKPRRSQTLLFLIVALLWAVALIWWLRRPQPISDVGQPLPTPTTHTVPPSHTLVYTLFLPNDQALLTRHSVTEKNSFSAKPDWTRKANRALELLCKRLKDLPQGTRLLGVPQRDAKGIVTVNLNAAFKKLDTSPETAVALVLDAMAKTLGAVNDPNGKPVKLRVLVEGKPLTVFNQYDLSEPWTSTQPEDETAPDAESVQ